MYSSVSSFNKCLMSCLHSKLRQHHTIGLQRDQILKIDRPLDSRSTQKIVNIIKLVHIKMPRSLPSRFLGKRVPAPKGKKFTRPAVLQMSIKKYQ